MYYKAPLDISCITKRHQSYTQHRSYNAQSIFIKHRFLCITRQHKSLQSGITLFMYYTAPLDFSCITKRHQSYKAA